MVDCLTHFLRQSSSGVKLETVLGQRRQLAYTRVGDFLHARRQLKGALLVAHAFHFFRQSRTASRISYNFPASRRVSDSHCSQSVSTSQRVGGFNLVPKLRE